MRANLMGDTRAFESALANAKFREIGAELKSKERSAAAPRLSLELPL